jgi:hypothetical protein
VGSTPVGEEDVVGRIESDGLGEKRDRGVVVFGREGLIALVLEGVGLESEEALATERAQGGSRRPTSDMVWGDSWETDEHPRALENATI